MAGQILFVGKTDSRLDKTWSRLEASGYEVRIVRSRKPALEAIASQLPAAVVVDMTVPRTGAERFCTMLRKQAPNVPVLVLMDDEHPPPTMPHDKSVNRAASYRRLSSTLLRLLNQHRDPTLIVGSLRLNPVTRVVQMEQGEALLSPKEAQLLTTFMRHPGKVLRHRLLMKAVWDTDFVDDLGTLWTHVCALREKIEPYPDRRVYLHTVRGIGYRLDVWPPPLP